MQADSVLASLNALVSLAQAGIDGAHPAFRPALTKDAQANVNVLMQFLKDQQGADERNAE